MISPEKQNALESQTTLDIFTELLAIPAPSKQEKVISKHVFDLLTSWGYAPESDKMGNVWVRFVGQDETKQLRCFVAHLDEIGMTIDGIHADGTLAVSRSGGLRPWKIGEGPVTILGDFEHITGVFSMGSTHTPNTETAVRWRDCQILTGLSAEQLEVAGVRAGVKAVPINAHRGTIEFGDPADPLVGAWTFDDRLGCAIVLRALQRMKQTSAQPLAPTIVGFSVQEEIGGFGAIEMSQQLKPDMFIAIDGAPMPPEAEIAIDGRPAMWTEDQICKYDDELMDQIRASANAVGTDIQSAVYHSTASDGSLVHRAGACQRVACFGHVRENSHGYEVIRKSVVANVVETLLHMILNFA